MPSRFGIRNRFSDFVGRARSGSRSSSNRRPSPVDSSRLPSTAQAAVPPQPPPPPLPPSSSAPAAASSSSPPPSSSVPSSSQAQQSSSAQAGTPASPGPAAITIAVVGPSASSQQASPSPIPPRPPLSTTPAAYCRFSAEAIASLPDPVDRELVRKYLQQDPNVDPRAAIEGALQAANDQRQRWQGDRWRVSLRGREVVLRDKVDEVVAWIRRFEAAGDVAASADPVHIGLPWAGIKALLRIVSADASNMAALLSGMALAMPMVTRLKVYFAYLKRLPSTDATDAFEKSLVRIYAMVLRFLDKVVTVYQQSGLTRLWDAIWQESDLDDFEKKCNSWGIHVALDVDNCDRELMQQHADEAERWRKDLEGVFRGWHGDLQEIQNSLTQLHNKADQNKLDKLPIAPQAIYDSFDEQQAARCLPGTRTDILRQILHWANDINGKRIFWLCGMAGTGKSAVSRTVAHILGRQRYLGADSCLGLSFFFKRGEGLRGESRCFFPTIAVQLIALIPALGPMIADAVGHDPLASSKGLKQQFETLILNPLQSWMQSQGKLLNVVIVLDALDECAPLDAVPLLLTQLARLGSITSVHLRVFVTSRPDPPIKRWFNSASNGSFQDIRLEEVPPKIVEHDIRAYLKYEMARIRTKMQQTCEYDDLPADWPGEHDVEKLVQLALPLFIFASTVCRFIEEEDSEERLQTVLQQSNTAPNLKRTYGPILEQALHREDEQSRKVAIDRFRELVGSIVLLASPLSVPSLASLLELKPRSILERLERLQSVLNIPKNHGDAPIRLLHLSFRDFLVDIDNQNDNPFRIDMHQTHYKLTLDCLRLLSRPGTLKRDICEVGKLGTKWSEITEEMVKVKIPADVSYACTYWVFHLAESGRSICDDGPEHKFLVEHFLHWLEALTWLGRFPDAVYWLSALKSSVQPNQSGLVSSFIEDANRFVLWSLDMAELAPLQLYFSALIFAPEKSLVKQTFVKKYPQHLFDILPKPASNWSAHIQTLKGNTESVSSLAFSPDGTSLTSIDWQGIILVRDAQSGAVKQEIFAPRHGSSYTLSYLPSSGDKVLISYSGGTIRVWDTITGEEMETLELPGSERVAFSPNAKSETFASESGEGSIQLWSTVTWQETYRQDEDAHLLAFFSDAVKTMVALRGLGYGMYISVVRDSTEQLLYVLEEDVQYLTAITFSADGQLLAAGVNGYIAKIWSAPTWKTTQQLKHIPDVSSLAFSSDSKKLASGCDNGDIYLWDTTTWEMRSILRRSFVTVQSLSFAPNGVTLASTAFDSAIYLWNTKTSGDEELTSGEVPSDVTAMAVSHGAETIITAHPGRFQVWYELAEGPQHLLELNPSISCVALSPDARKFAYLMDYDHQTWLGLRWVSTGKKISQLRLEFRSISSETRGEMIKFSSDGRLLASYYHHSLIDVWDLTTDTLITSNEVDSINCLAFSCNGQLLATLDYHNSITIYNIATNTKMRTLQASPEFDRESYELAFSDNGNLFQIDTGALDLQPSAFFPLQHIVEQKMRLYGGWIQYEGEDILWLPPEYRPGVLSDESANVCVRNNTLIVGAICGACFFRFKWPPQRLGG